MDLLKDIAIFYDGTNIEKYAKLDYVKGFTTNTTFMVQGNQLNYSDFYNRNKELINNRPISLQLYSDDDFEMVQQAQQISNLGENVYVKVPVIKSTGESNEVILEWLLQRNFKVNITAIFTEQQLLDLYPILVNKEGVIISIFAGRISDTGVNPFEIIKFACKLYPKAHVLWAGCKEVLSIRHAIHAGCKIITIPDSIMDRLSRINKDLTEFSQETVQSFKKDGEKLSI